ncbi:uncharacterized protein LOC144631974 isoform X3 [Oculina patagonica]
MEIVSFDKGKMKTFVLICFLVTSATCHTAACSNNINKEGVIKRITIDDDLSQQSPGVIEINLSSINVMVTLKVAENTTDVSARYLFKRQKKSNIEEKKLDSLPQQFFKKTSLPEINFTTHLPRQLNTVQNTSHIHPTSSEQDKRSSTWKNKTCRVKSFLKRITNPVTHKQQSPLVDDVLTGVPFGAKGLERANLSRSRTRTRTGIVATVTGNETKNEYWIKFKNVTSNWTWESALHLVTRVCLAACCAVALYFTTKWFIWYKRVMTEKLKIKWQKEREKEIQLARERLARRGKPERRPKNKPNRRR